MKLKILFLIACLNWSPVRAADPAPPDILAGLKSEHPRLLLTVSGLTALRQAGATNQEVAAIIAKTEAEARLALTDTPLIYQKQGKRLLTVSREALRRILLWSFAYRLTGDKVFLEHAQTEMLNLAAFKDWNPPHFLDVAEMTTAMAIGYDWLFNDLPVSARATIRQAIFEKGITLALDGKAGWNYWRKTQNNWNQVCFGGLTLGALAIAEDGSASATDGARKILEIAREDNSHGLQPYAPDGIYPEGPGYWAYGTTYEVLMISALQSALGTDWNLSAAPGFLASAAALVEQTGPTGRPFNFSDGHDGVAFDPAMFWFAQKLHQPGLVNFQNKQLLQTAADKWKNAEPDRFFPLLALWTCGLPKEIPSPPPPLAWHGDGPNPVGVFRSSWTDTNALFLAFKGGSASNNHGHMDAGSFVLDADGVRWACDLGGQNYYSIESKGWHLWRSSQNSDRWRVYRLNNFSHNTLTLGGKLHNAAGHARITEFSSDSATVDLTSIFAPQAERVTRQFVVGKNRTVLIRDEIVGAKPGLSVRWQMVTHSAIQLKKNQAELRQNGRSLRAKILSPADAQFETASAQPPDDGVNQPNPNTRILAVNMAMPVSGKTVLEIQLEPGQ